MNNKGQLTQPVPLEPVIIAIISIATYYTMLNAEVNLFSSATFALGIGLAGFSLWARWALKS